MKEIKLINYKLQFEPIFHNFTFNGLEIITVNLLKPSNSITLNAAELKIKKCSLIQRTKTIGARAKLNEKNESLSITFSKRVKGLVKVRIEFTGMLNDLSLIHI